MKKIVAVACAAVVAACALCAGGCGKKTAKPSDMPQIPSGVTLSKVENENIADTFSAFAEKYGKSENMRAEFAFERSVTVADGAESRYDYAKRRISQQYLSADGVLYGDATASVNETAEVRRNGDYTVSSPGYAEFNYSERHINPATAKLRGEGVYLYSDGEKSYLNDKLQYSADGLKGYYSDFTDYGTMVAEPSVLVRMLGAQDIFESLEPALKCFISCISAGQSVEIEGINCPVSGIDATADIRADETRLFMEMNIAAACKAGARELDYSVKASLYLDTAADNAAEKFGDGTPDATQTSGVRYLDITSGEFFDKFFAGEPLSFTLKGGGDPSEFGPAAGSLDFNYSYDGKNGWIQPKFICVDGTLTVTQYAFEELKNDIETDRGEKFDMDKLEFCYFDIRTEYERRTGSGEDTRLYECKTVLFLYYEIPLE